MQNKTEMAFEITIKDLATGEVKYRFETNAIFLIANCTDNVKCVRLSKSSIYEKALVLSSVRKVYELAKSESEACAFLSDLIYDDSDCLVVADSVPNCE